MWLMYRVEGNFIVWFAQKIFFGGAALSQNSQIWQKKSAYLLKKKRQISYGIVFLL